MGESRSRVQERIKDGGVSVDGEVVRRPSHVLAAGGRVELAAVPRSRERPGSQPGAAFRVVHEDATLVVLDKPAGMVVHPSSVVVGGTLAELAAERYGELPALQGEDRPGVVHRLDAETSGLLVLARTREAGEELLRQFREREVEKLYLALVHGDPRFESDWIEAPIGRSARRSDRMSVVAEGEGREARTFYEVRERFGAAALLACRPVTGRTHQIRVHLTSIGHSIVGDRLYRPKGGAPALPPGIPGLARHALHAVELRLTHPATGERLGFEAPLPVELASVLEALRS